MNRRIFYSLVFTLIGLVSYGNTFPWESIPGEVDAHRFVFSATSSAVIDCASHCSAVLPVPFDTESIAMAVRSGTAEISYATVAISGTNSDLSLNLGLFSDRDNADWYVANQNAIGEPPAYKALAVDSSTPFKAINDKSYFTTFGDYRIDVDKGVAALVVWASPVYDATKVGNEGITIDIRFVRKSR